MSIRKLLQVGVVTIGLGGALVPMVGDSVAQVTTDRTATTTNDDGPDFGWIGIFGLAGLAGLLGNRREDRMARHSSATSPAR